MAKSTLRKELEALQEEHNQLQEEHNQLQADLDQAIDITKRAHEDHHTGVFRYCAIEPCRTVGTLEYEPDSRHWI